MNDDLNESVEFDSELEDEDVEFESDEEVEEALHQRTARTRLEGLKARGRHALSGAAERGRERLHNVADRGRGRLADAIDSTADRLDDRLSHSANYLRTNDVDVIGDDLANQIRRHPLLSAGIALGTGYLVGKVLGNGSSRRGRRGRKRALVENKLGRAVLSSVGAVMAARVRDSLTRRPPRSPDMVDD